MKQHFAIIFSLGVAALAGVLFHERGALAAAKEYKVEALKEAPPEALSEQVRAVLETAAYRVEDGEGKIVADVWLRKELAVDPKFKPSANVKYGFPRSHLIGAIRFPDQGGADLRAQKIKPGVYTLRYAQQPVDGNHVGTWPFQDFLVLLTPKQDAATEDRDEREVMEASLAGRVHPAIMSLMPPAERDKLPAVTHRAENDLWILALPTKAKAGSETQDIHLELVVKGKAEI